jgi:hypothetical protein
MAPPNTESPTRDQLEDAVALVLNYSVTTTEAAADFGLSYNAFRKRGIPVFKIGREHRIWLIDLQ